MYKKTPEAKEKAKKREKRYRNSPHGKAHGQAYRQLPRVKESIRKAVAKYLKTEKAKTTRSNWKKSESGQHIIKKSREKWKKGKGKDYYHKYVRSPRGKGVHKKAKRTYYTKHPEKATRYNKKFDPIKFKYIKSINDECEWAGCDNKKVTLNHILTREYCDKHGMSELKYEERNLIGFCDPHHYIWHYLHWNVARRKTPHHRILGVLKKGAIDYFGWNTEWCRCR